MSRTRGKQDSKRSDEKDLKRVGFTEIAFDKQMSQYICK